MIVRDSTTGNYGVITASGGTLTDIGTLLSQASQNFYDDLVIFDRTDQDFSDFSRRVHERFLLAAKVYLSATDRNEDDFFKVLGMELLDAIASMTKDSDEGEG